MKKNYNLLILIALFAFTGWNNNANAQWAQSNTSLLGTKVSGLVSSGSDFIAACGSVRTWVSHDGGTSWTSCINGLASTSYWCLATNGTDVFVGGDQGVFSTNDNGSTWTTKGLSSASIYAIAVNGSTVIAGSYSGDVYFSSNSGTTWTTVPLGLTTQQLYSLTIHGSYIFAGTYDGLYVSANNGATWTLAPGLPTNPAVHALLTVGSNVYAGTHGNGIYVSANDGASWTTSNNGLTYPYITSLASNGSSILAGSNYYGAFLSNDNGASWTDVSGNLPNTDFVSCAVSNSIAMVGGSSSNRAWNTPLSQITTGIKTAEKGMSVLFYPNPVSDQLTLELKDTKNAEAEIFNMEGKLILSISLLTPTTVVKTDNLVSGLYFIKVINQRGISVQKFVKD